MRSAADRWSMKHNKWFKGGVNLTGSWTKRDYNSNASGNYYANPFYITRYMAPVYPLFMHNADGTYQLDADGNKNLWHHFILSE